MQLKILIFVMFTQKKSLWPPHFPHAPTPMNNKTLPQSSFSVLLTAAVASNVNINYAYFQTSFGSTIREGSGFNSSMSRSVPRNPETVRLYFCSAAHHTIHGLLWRLVDFGDHRRWRRTLHSLSVFRLHIKSISKTCVICSRTSWQTGAWRLIYEI